MGTTGKGGKDQVTRGTSASAVRKVLGDREKFETLKGEKRTAVQITKRTTRKEKTLASDFPLGTTGLYLTVLGFAAFVAAVLYWVVIIALPKD